jgi:Sec-independent protein translocase protein TatA
VIASLRGQEAVIVVVLALLVIGGSQLPKIIGTLAEWRRDSTDDDADEAVFRRHDPLDK